MKILSTLLLGGTLAIGASSTSLSAPSSLVPTDTAIGLISDVMSFGASETALLVHNDSGAARNIRVEWFHFDSTPAGTTGPFVLLDGQRGTFVTSNPGEVWSPIIAFFGRVETIDIRAGYGVVYSDPGGYRGIAMDAIRVSGRLSHTDGTDQSYHGVRVMRIKPNGLPRHAGD